jgi:hypothetical protein
MGNNPLCGFIEIEITQEHIDALQSVQTERVAAISFFREKVKVPRLFGLFHSSVYKHEATRPSCPMLGLYDTYDGERYITTTSGYQELNVAIRNCVGKTVYLSLFNYDTLAILMNWYERNKNNA